jgi:hypothetical protein
MKSGTILQLFTTTRACLVVTRCVVKLFFCVFFTHFFLPFQRLSNAFQNPHLARAFQFDTSSCTAHAMRGEAGPACGFLAVLITVTLSYAATAPGDAAVDGLLAGPASLRRASPPSRYPPSWATRCAANPARCLLCSPIYFVFSHLAWYLRPSLRRLTEAQAQASCSLAFPCVD